MIVEAIAAGLGTLSAIASVSRGSITVRRAVADRVRTTRKRTANRERFLRLLSAGSQSTAAYRISTAHPTVPAEQLPHADLDALGSLLDSALVAGAIDAGVFDDDDPALDIELDLILIGSAESEPVTRLVFGYERLDGDGGVRYRGDTLPLVYRWEEEAPPPPAVWCMHRRAGGVIAVRPNWKIVGVDPSPTSYIPRVAGGYLREDFLLITKVPNFLSRRAFESGRSIVSIGGLHAPGTRAIRNVLASDDLLEEVLTRLDGLPKRSPWFQLLFKVTSIEHENPVCSMPATVELTDVVALAIDDAAVGAARAAAEAHVPDWLEGTKAPAMVTGRLGFDLTPPFLPENQTLIDELGRW